MPIKGLSDARRLPRVGSLRLGDKGGTNAAPREVNYFICDPATGNQAENDELLQAFTTLYGNQPTSLPVVLPPVRQDMIFDSWRKRFSKSGLLCKGDGDTATCANGFTEGLELIDPATKDDAFIPVKCYGPDCPYSQKDERGRSACTPVGTLNVLLPDIHPTGCWQITTRSVNSIINIQSDLDWIIGMCGGNLQGMPATLRRVPQELSYQGKKKTHFLLRLEADKSVQLTANHVRKAITAASEDNEQEPGELLDQPQEEVITTHPDTKQPFRQPPTDAVSSTAVPTPAPPQDIISPPQAQTIGTLFEELHVALPDQQPYYKNLTMGRAMKINELSSAEATTLIANLRRMVAEASV